MRKLLVAAPLLLAGCLVYEDREVIPGRRPVSTSEVIRMHQDGATGGALRAEIAANGVIAKPSADDLVAMKQAGVPDSVMKAMVEAPVTTPREPQTIVRRSYYYDGFAEDVAFFGLGALLGWSLHRHSHHHRHYRGCGHGGW